jgi:hypothetical protein
MQTVITIEFDGQLRRIQTATPEEAIAGLRDECEEDGRESGVNLNTLSVHCVTGIDTLVLFDQRTNDKKILIVTQDEPTLVRYVIASPLMTDEQKEFAQSELDYLTENDPSVSAVQHPPFEEDDRVLYCAPNFGQE